MLTIPKILVLGLFLSAIMLFLGTTKVHAIPTDLVNGVSPGSDTSDAVVSSDNPWHTLLETQHGSVGAIDLGVYFDSGGNKSITFNVATAFCHMDTIDASYDWTHAYIFIDGLNGPGSSLGIPGRQICSTTLANKLDGRSFTIQSGALQQNYQGTTKWGTKLKIRFVNDSDPNVPNKLQPIRPFIRPLDGGLGRNVRFKINVSGNGLIGYVDTNSSSSAPNNSIVHMANDPSDASTNVYYPFGLKCGSSDRTAAGDGLNATAVTLYDADQGQPAQGTVISFYVGTVGSGGNVTALDDSDYVHQNGSILMDDTGTKVVDKIQTVNGHPQFYPGDYNNQGGNTTVYLKTVKADTHYVLMVRNLANGQFIYIGLPGDALFGSPQFDYSTDCMKGKLICTLTNTTGDIAIGQSENVTVQADASNYGGSPPNRVNMLLKDPPFANKTASPGPVSPSNLNTYKQPWTVGPYNSPGVYTLDATVTDPNDASITADCPGTFTFTVSARPYMSVFGGDAAAGVSPELNGSAYAPYTNSTKPGGFVGWNDGDINGWGSAGAEWAVQALGKITGFRSARAITAGTPQYLSFTNTPANVSGIIYGGKYDGIGNIKVDYASDIASAAAGDVYSTDLNGLGGTVPTSPSNKQTVVVKGGHDAFIGSSLTYNIATPWANVQAIPSYKLIVVGGDIYIGNNVSELDGTYVSIYDASTGKGGNIYTCASGLRAPINYTTAAGTFYDTCRVKQLKVFGSLVAKQIHLDRTSGSYGNQTKTYSTTDAAEAIIYGPESWLSSTPGGTSNYSAITGLPPIL